MGTVIQAKISQTHYVTVRRDELQQLKEERAQLQRKVDALTSILEQARQALS
jgi:cell division protein FtsB